MKPTETRAALPAAEDNPPSIEMDEAGPSNNSAGLQPNVASHSQAPFAISDPMGEPWDGLPQRALDVQGIGIIASANDLGDHVHVSLEESTPMSPFNGEPPSPMADPYAAPIYRYERYQKPGNDVFALHAPDPQEEQEPASDRSSTPCGPLACAVPDALHNDRDTTAPVEYATSQSTEIMPDSLASTIALNPELAVEEATLTGNPSSHRQQPAECQNWINDIISEDYADWKGENMTLPASPADKHQPAIHGTLSDGEPHDSLSAPPPNPRAASLLQAPTPPSSPKQPPVDQVEDLVETAIDRVKQLRLCEGVFGPGPIDLLMSTLEKIRLAVSDRTVMQAPFDASSTFSTPGKHNDVDTLVSLLGKFSQIPSEDPTVEKLIMATEKYFVKASPPTPPSSSNNSDTGENENDEKGKSTSQPTMRPKLEHKHVDEVWSEKKGKYDIVDLTDSKHDELDEFLFVVRDRIDKNTLEKTTFVDIKSTWIRDILREACCDLRNVSLADNKPSIEFNALFHVRAGLQQHMKCISDSPSGKHLDVFLRYLDTAFKPTDDRLSVLLAGRKITYDLLWALFKPNEEVYTTCKGTQASRCLLFNQMEEKKDMSGSKYMHLETRYLGSDGKALGEVTTSSSIPIFRGEMQIESLTAYPLQYHPEKDAIRSQLEECGRHFVSLLGIHHRQYKGRAFDYDEKGNIVAYHVEGNIMVDSECFQESMPNYPCPRTQKVRPQWSVLGRCEAVKLVDIEPEQLKPKDFLICSPTVLGFSLTKKRFLEFAVTHVTDVSWSECSFEDVNIPESQKKAIHALTDTFLNRAADDAFHDFVQGKGRGINFLLYGPPGVGKTLTAETLAETFKAPLYTVAAGQIGVDHIRVEKYLKNIFKIASRWGAILLLDEADVFLTERGLDPHSNALVSVFLRELEHFDGILFLTTNRMQAFDPAILSRIHLPLRYEPLRTEARAEVWRFFLRQATTSAGPAIYDDRVIDDLAMKNLNGREIRNSVLVARSMAQFDGKVVNKFYLKESVEMRRQLGEDHQGHGAIQNTNSYV